MTALLHLPKGGEVSDLKRIVVVFKIKKIKIFSFLFHSGITYLTSFLGRLPAIYHLASSSIHIPNKLFILIVL